VKQASKRAPRAAATILIENTAGMGTAVGAPGRSRRDSKRGCGTYRSGRAWIRRTFLGGRGYDIKSEGGLASTIGQIYGAIGSRTCHDSHE